MPSPIDLLRRQVSDLHQDLVRYQLVVWTRATSRPASRARTSW
jgi:hypothetical protein